MFYTRPPVRFPIADPQSPGVPYRTPREWAQFFLDVFAALRAWTVSLTAQTAAIAATTIVITTLPAVPSGLFRWTFYARIATPAGTSSSVTVTAFWTDGGVACSHVFAAITGNTTATNASGTTLLRADPDTAIGYSVAYASNPGAAMAYNLDIELEARSRGGTV